MQQLSQWLQGKKTYLGMIAAGILGILWTCGKITDEQAGIAASIITAWTGIAIRSAWNQRTLPPQSVTNSNNVKL